MRTVSVRTARRQPHDAARERGFTLVELLVAMTLFLVLSAVVLTAMITLSKGLDRTRLSSDVSAEARVALERMAREVRQAKSLESPTATAMTVNVDFDGSGVIDGTLADPEKITYAYDASTDSIAMTAKDGAGATVTQDLLAGQVTDLTFAYRSSNWARYSPTQEVSIAADVDRVEISLTVEDGGQTDHFTTQVTLRNRSQS
jgi:prepilin-type N-terminal cleavage/methylation domain-containing protein